MSLRKKIPEDIKKALRERNTLELSVLRMLQASVRNREIEKKFDLDDSQVIEVVASEIKKRRETAEEFRRMEREDAAQKEESEIDILMKYMPQQMERDEIVRKVRESIERLKPSGLKDIGVVMKDIMPELKGKADGKVINSVVREELEKLD